MNLEEKIDEIVKKVPFYRVITKRKLKKALEKLAKNYKNKEQEMQEILFSAVDLFSNHKKELSNLTNIFNQKKIVDIFNKYQNKDLKENAIIFWSIYEISEYEPEKFDRYITILEKELPQTSEEIDAISDYIEHEKYIKQDFNLYDIVETSRTFNLLVSKCRKLSEEAKKTAYDWAYKAINANYKFGQEQGRQTLKQIQDFLENDEEYIKMMVYAR